MGVGRQEKYVAIQDLQPGPGVFAAAERAGRVGREASLLFRSWSDGAVGYEGFRAQLQQRGRRALRSAMDAGVWLYAYAAMPAALDFAPPFAVVCSYTGKEVDPAYEQRFFE